MSILEQLFYFITVLLIGYFVVKAGWKLRYLAPLCFVGVFLIVFLYGYTTYSSDVRDILFFTDGKFSPNLAAMNILILASGLSGIATFLLVVIVWAIRNDVYF